MSNEVVMWRPGVQDGTNWGVPDSGVLHDQRQEELPAAQSSGHGLRLLVQTGETHLGLDAAMFYWKRNRQDYAA